MPRANKTARISTGGYYPPRGLYEPMETHEEEPQEQEVDSPAPAHAPAPTPKPLQEEPKVEDDDEEKEAYLLDSNYVHHAHRATMEDSIEDEAAEACMGLCGRRFDYMKEDQYRFLPHQHPELKWAIMDPEGTDPTTQVMVHFGYELVGKIW